MNCQHLKINTRGTLVYGRAGVPERSVEYRCAECGKLLDIHDILMAFHIRLHNLEAKQDG